MKQVEVKKTFKEIVEDIKDIELSQKLVGIGVICLMICILLLLIVLIIASFNKGVICGLFATLGSVGVYAIFTGLIVDVSSIDLYKTEWVEDDK